MRTWTAISWFALLVLAENLCQAASIPKSTVPVADKTKANNVEQNPTLSKVRSGKQMDVDEAKHSAIKKKINGINDEHNEEKLRKFSGIQYTPLDLAEYIFRTRDEEGVALAIEELLKEGLIDREEAISYLESVKKELDNLKLQYNLNLQQQKKNLQTPQPSKATRPTEADRDVVEGHESLHNRRPSHPSNHNDNQIIKEVHSAPAGPKSNHSDQTVSAKPKAKETKTSQDKPKESDSLYEEYLLENVIYQLAKDMFSQSMMRDDASAEQLLSRFASFLENELADKKFSKESQEKILDTVSAALIESLRERLYLDNWIIKSLIFRNVSFTIKT